MQREQEAVLGAEATVPRGSDGSTNEACREGGRKCVFCSGIEAGGQRTSALAEGGV